MRHALKADGAGPCAKCGCERGALAFDCPGEPLSDMLAAGVENGMVEYFAARWWVLEPMTGRLSHPVLAGDAEDFVRGYGW